MQQAYRFALDPTPRQARMLAAHAGAARYAYNWGIAQVSAAMDAFKAAKAAGVPEKDLPGFPGHFELCKMWTRFKDDPANEVGWVGENFSGTYQAALRDAAAAWKNFIDWAKGRRKGRRVGRPKFKAKRKSKPAFQVHGNVLRVSAQYKVRRHFKSWKQLRRTHQTFNSLRFHMPVIGPVRVLNDNDWRWRRGHQLGGDKERNVRVARRLRDLINSGQGRIVRANISQEPDGLWFASVTVELQGTAAEQAAPAGPTRRQRAGGTVGVDLGVKYLATLSTGEVLPNPGHYAAAMTRLRTAQQALSRTQEGSRRRERARQRVAVLHARVRRARQGGIVRAAASITRAYEHIVVEGWDVQQTLQHGSKDVPKAVRRARNRVLADAARGEFRTRLQLVAPRKGSSVTVLDAHAPTGRTCSACGEVRTKPVAPHEDTFTCPACGHAAPRRLNTARALVRLAAPQAAPQGAESRGGDVRPGTPRRDGRSPSKRAARTRSQGRDKTGTPDP